MSVGIQYQKDPWAVFKQQKGLEEKALRLGFPGPFLSLVLFVL
jgi:hypothetical protein